MPAWVAACVVGMCLLALEVGVRVAYTAPGELMGKLDHARATLRADAADVLVFGTCIADQALDRPPLERALGAAGRVHSLSAPGAGPMDWYLTLRRALDPELVDGVVLVYTPGDLSIPTLTWQSQTMDLMDLYSMREVAFWACTDPGCVADLYARRTSLFYRNRPYLANRVWTAVGARAMAATATPERRWKAPKRDRADAPWHFVRRIVELSAERDTPLLFVELPLNPDVAAAHRAERDQVQRRLTELGATVVSPPPPDGGFVDDVHYTARGRAVITEAVGLALQPMVADPR